MANVILKKDKDKKYLKKKKNGQMLSNKIQITFFYFGLIDL